MAQVVAPEAREFGLAGVVGCEVGPAGKQLGARRLPHADGEPGVDEGLPVPMEHQPAGAFAVELSVLTELVYQERRHRDPAALCEISVLQRTPFGVLVGVEPPILGRTMGAPDDKPTGLIGRGQFQVLARRARPPLPAGGRTEPSPARNIRQPRPTPPR